jgi:hypothetical protein
MADRDQGYDVAQQAEWIRALDEDVRRWRPFLVAAYGSEAAEALLQDCRRAFDALVPHIPYIGGEESWTDSLLESVRCLALYRAMRRHGRTAAETGRILWDAVMARRDEPLASIAPSQVLTPEQLTERRRRRAKLSQERRHPGGFVCTYVPGDGQAFDYGYDYTECASQKLYRAHGAVEFLPYYCYLDFAYSRIYGLGLARSMTLAEGDEKCNHRFKKGRETRATWPPPFLRSA